MARFITITAITDASLGRKLRTGTVIVDAAANVVLPTDVICPAFCNNPSPLALLPLDASAQSRMPLGTPIYTGGPLPPSPWGCGGDAGA